LKVRLAALSLRLGFAWLLFSLTVFSLFLFGMAQNFLDSTLRNLFFNVRWLSWCGLLGNWLLLVPLVWHQRRRLAVAILMGFSFAGLFSFVLFLGTWIYPNMGNWPW